MNRPLDDSPPRWADRRVIGITLLGVLMVTLLLQVWRPYFYLTDDSLTGFFPVGVDTSRALWGGRSISVSAHLFGGRYDMTRDAGCIALWSPWLFLFSPLALTKHYAVLVDAMSFANSCTIAVAFAASMLFLRRRLDLAASDFVIVLAAISYTFTPFNLLIGASWLGFLNAQVVYPVALAASYARRWWIGSVWIAAAFLFGLVGGHLHTTIMASLFGGFMVTTVAIARRSWSPIVAFACGGLLALVIVSPWLLTAFEGFGQAERSNGMTAVGAARESYSLDGLLESVVFGPYAMAWSQGRRIFEAEARYGLSLVFSLINIPALVALACAIRDRKMNRLTWAMLVFLVGTAVWMIHPAWLTFLHIHTPLLKSLRWPFREATIVLFAIHVLFVLHAPALWQLARPIRLAIVCFSAGALGLFLLNRAPSLNELSLDRQLILSGEADRYWEKVNADSVQPLRIVVGSSPIRMQYGWRRFPFSALGAYNFSALFNVVNVSGYSVTIPKDRLFYKVPPLHWSGIFHEDDARRMAELTPGLSLVTMRSLKTLRWTISSPHGDRWFRYDDETGKIVAETGPPPPESTSDEP